MSRSSNSLREISRLATWTGSKPGGGQECELAVEFENLLHRGVIGVLTGLTSTLSWCSCPKGALLVSLEKLNKYVTLGWNRVPT